MQNPYFISQWTDELGRLTHYDRFPNGIVGQAYYPDGSTEGWNGLNAFNEPGIHRYRNGANELFIYDSTGLVTKKSTPFFSNESAAWTIYTYYPAGHPWQDRLKTVTDPLGHTTTYEYDLQFVNGVQGTTPCPGRGLVTKITYADGSYKSFGYDIYGNKLWEENELRQRTSYTYDDYNRLLTVTDPLGHVTQTQYGDTTAQAQAFTANAPRRVISPFGRITAWLYDADKRPTLQADGDWSGDTRYWQYQYDAVGNRTSVSEQVGGTAGSGNEVYRTTTYAYDNRNRKRFEYAPLGRTTEWQYDGVGNVLKTVNPDGTYRTKTYDAMNQPLTDTDERSYTTTYTYWPSGKVNTITDARGSVHSHTYDHFDLLTQRTYPDNSAESWTYDNAGNKTTYTNRSGQILRYTYDNRNRETNRAWDNSAAPAVATGYDLASRVTSRSNSNSTVTYVFDAAGELTSTRQAVSGGPSINLIYGYDADGLRTSFQSSVGTWIGYAYNHRKEMIQVQQWSGNAPFSWCDYTRDAGGEVVTRSDYSGVRDDFTYDGAGRLTYRNTVRNSDGASLLLRRYGYDLRDRRTWTTRNDAYGDTYEYLPDSELSRFRYQVYRPDQNFWNTAASTQTYAYDGVGNRTSVNNNGSVVNYTANSLNQYTSITGVTISHSDGRGNVTGYNGWTYTYDADNRLVSAASSGYSVQFYYDPEGRLAKVNRNGAWECRYYDGTQCYLRCQTNGIWIDFMTWGAAPDELLARWDAAHGGWSFFHQDPVNSPDVATNIWGTVVERYRYDPYGQPSILDPSWNVRSASTISNPWLFTGQEWMSDLGLSNYKNRFYSPALGRFLQNDPIRFDGGDGNLYRYVINNPINLTDTTGFVITITSFDSAGHQRTISNQERATWDKAVSQMSKSPEGRAMLAKANSPNFQLDIQSQPGNEPGGNQDPNNPNHGTIFIDLNDPSGISPDRRDAMYDQAIAKHHVDDRADFDKQLSHEPGVVIGHEFGHAVNGDLDENEGGKNVQKNENPIRKGIGLPPREKYWQVPIPPPDTDTKTTN